MSAIGDLLTASREAHQQYRDSLPRRVSDGASGTVAVPGDAEVAANYLATACRLRADAHVLDPQQADPAWLDQPVTYPHDALLNFYVDQLIAAPDAVAAVVPDLQATVAEAQADSVKPVKARRKK